MLGLLALGCGEGPTIVVAVSAPDTNVGSYRITVERNEKEKYAETHSLTLPSTLTLENGEPDDLDDDIRVAVRDDVGVITRSATLRFDADRSVLLRLPLCSACEGVACPDGETCVSGICSSDTVDVDDLPEPDGEELTGSCSELPEGGCRGTCGTADCGDCPTTPRVTAGTVTIDATEVTRGAYAAWLAVTPNPATLGPVCEHVAEGGKLDSFYLLPDADCSPAEEVCQGDCDAHPQVCITPCGAEAYCNWAGGSLCESWIDACTGTGGGPYPYGATYEDGRCNINLETGSTLPVGSMSTCEGGYPGLYDMSGNVAEITGSCSLGGVSSNCSARGGSYRGNDPSIAQCSSGDIVNMGDKKPWFGFRCCY